MTNDPVRHRQWEQIFAVENIGHREAMASISRLIVLKIALTKGWVSIVIAWATAVLNSFTSLGSTKKGVKLASRKNTFASMIATVRLPYSKGQISTSLVSTNAALSIG